MFVLGKVLSTTAVLLCILCLVAPLKKNKGRAEKIKRTSDTAEAACVIWLAAACYRTYAWDYGR